MYVSYQCLKIDRTFYLMVSVVEERNFMLGCKKIIFILPIGLACRPWSVNLVICLFWQAGHEDLCIFWQAGHEDLYLFYQFVWHACHGLESYFIVTLLLAGVQAKELCLSYLL